ncbi:hypothetical protein DU80_20375 [Methanosarcina mazei]|uniref:Uncharacterized protein n=6 Tax=Methanosarcina mazei TaxID=2209 RepID=A0A0F8NUJ3_METMZ|nr:hypothetical protein MmTuc01_2855 [Methanosarcina mazei Tuc01]AKB40830.1 hypothetical protein MSMAW_1839 [Methanosarcina mazei WWM610]AKB68492.1 hypothetical protein MSMAL_1949 [Methanosarcina mazei LYC]AKB71088.1 hypothetical protein MSMAC_1198 [Methanosarcina mazei C16]KKF98592.1 hypothetical protein DU47_16870 [Methanosarcina mazei]UWJ22825.1 hypothetical protein MSMAT_1568 [Methanosarcina mazei TMA]
MRIRRRNLTQRSLNFKNKRKGYCIQDLVMMRGLESEYGVILPELRGHCKAAIRNFGNLNSSGDVDLHSSFKDFWTECSRVSAILWCKSDKKYRQRLRSVLSIADNSLLSPRLMSITETELKKMENLPGESQGGESQGIQKAAPFSYDPAQGVLKIQDKRLEILPLFMAVRDLYSSLPFFDELKSCTEMLEKDPRNATALFQKSLLLYKAGRFENSLKFIEQVLEIVPDDFRVWYNKGVILSDMVLLKEALDAYDRAIELEPSFEIVWDNKGVVLAGLGRLEEALETYEKVLLRDPKYAEAWAGKGSVLSALDRKEEALEAYSSALKIRPVYPEALKAAGNLLFKLGRYEKALSTYDMALQASPEDPGLWAGRGLVLSELNKQEEALQNCNRALELRPGFNPALEIKVEILSRISRQKAENSR